jgi:hypothetical protein
MTASGWKLPDWLLQRLIVGFFWLLAIVLVVYIILAVLGK